HEKHEKKEIVARYGKRLGHCCNSWTCRRMVMQTAFKIIVAALTVGCTLLAITGTGQAEEHLIPVDMVYVGHGPSVMGIDKEAPPDSGKKMTAYDKRMMTPWSAEAFNAEGPTHT